MSEETPEEGNVFVARAGAPGPGSWFSAVVEDAPRDAPALRVHGVVPGERISIRPRADDPGWADLVEVFEASPDRREAACPLFRECGGCHWLHIAPEAQERLREDALRAELDAAGVVTRATTWRTHAAPRPLGYRWRARLQADPLTRPARLGYHAAGSRRIVDAEQCPLFAPDLHAIYDVLREELRREPILALTGLEISLLPEAPGALLFLNPRDRPPLGWPLVGEALLERLSGHLAGIAVRPAGEPRRPDALGTRFIVGRTPSGHPAAVAARGFLQSNLEVADALAERVAALAAAGAGPRVLELFAGSGLLGWRLAERGAAVRAVELDASAVAAGRALPAPARGSLVWEDPAPAERLFAATRDAGFDVLVADPPRSGLGPLAREITEAGPERVLLVSCSVRSLARDLAVLTARGGYRLDALELFDLFPQSRHLETLALLTRTGSP